MKITRNFAGAEIGIELTEEEIRNIIAQFATITFRPAVKTEPEPKPIQEPEREWKPVRVYRTGVTTQHGDEIFKMYEQGLSCRQIAAHYGVTPATIKHFLVSNGMKMRGQGEATRLYFAKKRAA